MESIQQQDVSIENWLESEIKLIDLPEQYKIFFEEDEKYKGLYFVQLSVARIDAITGEQGFGFSGRYYIHPERRPSQSQFVQAVFGLYRGYLEHEARETFKWQGRRVFGPHIRTEALYEVARKIDKDLMPTNPD